MGDDCCAPAQAQAPEAKKSEGGSAPKVSTGRTRDGGHLHAVPHTCPRPPTLPHQPTRGAHTRHAAFGCCPQPKPAQEASADKPKAPEGAPSSKPPAAAKPADAPPAPPPKAAAAAEDKPKPAAPAPAPAPKAAGAGEGGDTKPDAKKEEGKKEEARAEAKKPEAKQEEASKRDKEEGGASKPLDKQQVVQAVKESVKAAVAASSSSSSS